MKTFHMIIGVFVAAALLGCTNRFQNQVEQSLLLQENQRLEDALYVTHAQLVDLKRENEVLRDSQGMNRSLSSPTPVLRSKTSATPSNVDADEAPTFEPTPAIELPPDAKGSDALPDSLKSTRSIPIPRPPKQIKVRSADVPVQAVETGFPELVLPKTELDNNAASPVWSPTR